jgi:hypothetical protein
MLMSEMLLGYRVGMKLVPDVIAGGSNGNGGTLVDVLLAQLITAKK